MVIMLPADGGRASFTCQRTIVVVVMLPAYGGRASFCLSTVQRIGAAWIEGDADDVQLAQGLVDSEVIRS